MQLCMLCRSLDGYWSENGCELKSRYEESQYRYVECRCMHLSTFALLMDLSDDDVSSDSESEFLRASAMLKHIIAIGLTSVRPSVRPSHAGTLSKRLNILSCFLHHTIAHSF